MLRKFMALCLLALFVLPLSSFAYKAKISGNILGPGGKPLPLAEVYFNQELLTTAGPGGSYAIEIDHAGKINLKFAGVNCQWQDWSLVLFEDSEFNLDVKLGRVAIPKTSEFYVIGDFNNFNFKKGYIPMIERGGKYYAELENTGDKIIYQILFINGENGRSINGQAASEYIFDGGGDYRSVINTEGEKVTIEFDPSLYPEAKEEATFTSNDKGIERSAMFNASVSALVVDLYYDFSDAIVIDAYDTLETIREKHLNKIEKFILENAKTNGDKIAGAFLYLQAAEYLKNKSIIELNNNILKEITNLLEPDSEYWKYEKYYAFALMKYLGVFDESQYFQDLIAKNPSEKTRIAVIVGCMRFFFENDNEEKGRIYYNMLLKNYPESDYARSARRKHKPDKNIVTGKTAPDFLFASLDDSTVTYSLESFKGKYLLIDFWGTWCAPCRKELPAMHSMYEKYADKGLNILSLAIDASPENVQKFRDGKWKMPWLHVFLKDGWDDEACDVFEVTGVPKPILIGPDSKILAFGGDLRGSMLEETLAKYLDNK